MVYGLEICSLIGVLSFSKPFSYKTYEHFVVLKMQTYVEHLPNGRSTAPEATSLTLWGMDILHLPWSLVPARHAWIWAVP